MLTTKGYAAQSGTLPLAPFQFERREPGAHDVLIEILYCGICHTDISYSRNQLPNCIFPMVPGHEIVGRVVSIGDSVTRHKEGDTVAVGNIVDSCRECAACKEGEEQYCEKGFIGAYSFYEKDGRTPTYGGYSSHIVIDENYVLRISQRLSPAGAAPLLCAGITAYSPLRRYKVGKGSRIAVTGLGGVGHMAVKLGAAMGAEVTVLSRSENKKTDALRMGACEYALTSDDHTFERLLGRFDLILNTVSGNVDFDRLMGLLKRDGTLLQLGSTDSGVITVNFFYLMMPRKSISGSIIGGIRETQEMLDFCAENGIHSDVEVIPIQKVNEAYERMLKSDVRYRFVIDMSSLR